MGKNHKKRIEIRFSEEDIKNLGIKLDWKGNGTQNDPITISNVDGLPERFTLSSSILYINILNCTFDHVILEKCQNISIRDCSFNQLGLVISSNNRIVNSSLSLLHLAFSYYNHLEGCVISKSSNISSRENDFRDCNLTDKARKRIEEDIFDPSYYVRLLLVAAIGVGLLIIILIIYYIINSFPLDVNLIIIIAISCAIISIYLILRRLVKNKNIHKDSNKIISEKFKKKNRSVKKNEKN